MIAIVANETTASLRRVYFTCYDATDGITPETGEAAGQPQISVNGAAWANSTNTLVAIGNGQYYLELSQAETIETVHSVITSRYKSANTTETPGTPAQIFSATPTDFGSTITGILGDMVTECRRVVKDIDIGVESEILWKDPEWIEFLNSAEKEICERALVIEDSSTASVCTIALVTGTASYSLDGSIIFVEAASPSWDDGIPLIKRTKKWLDAEYKGWRDLDDAEPKYIIEEQTDNLVVVPGVSSDYNGETLTLTVKRRPIVDLSLINTTPEIGSKYYDDMKIWALHRAFSKRDAEIYEEGKRSYYASHYYKLFESRVGPRPNANVQRIMKGEPTTGLQIQIYRR